MSIEKIRYSIIGVIVNHVIDDYFGFFYCEIDAPLHLYVGVLPFRRKDGTIYPLGEFQGWYFSE